MADEINQKIALDIRDALKALEELSKQGNKSAKKIEEGFGAVQFNALLELGDKALKFGKIIADGFKLAVDEASKFEDSVNGLSIAFGLSGITSKQATEDFLNFAQSLQETTKFGDDAVIATGSLIQSLANLPTDQLQRATKAALDLSTSLRIDLDSAARLVGKAAEGNVASFKKFGIEVRKGKTDAETFANALDALEKKFGGSSEKAINSFAGANARLNNAFDDLLKNIGFFITKSPQILESINIVTEGIVKLSKSAENNEGIFKLINNIAGALNALDGRQAVYDEIARSAENNKNAHIDMSAAVDESIVFAKSYRSELTRQNKELLVNKQLLEQIAKDAAEKDKQAKQVESDFSSLANAFKNFDLDPVQMEVNKTLQNFDTLEKARAQGLVSQTDFEALRLKIIEEGNKRVLDATKKQTEEEKAARLKIESRNAGIATSVIGGVQQGGAAGVASVAGGLLSNLGPYGAAAGAALQFLSQGPEAVKAQIQGFIDGIPQVIDAVAESIPVVIDVLVANSGKITTALSIQMPIVANKLAIELALKSPYIAMTFAQSLINEAGRIAQAIADAVKDVFKKAGGLFDGGGGIGGAGMGALVGGAIFGPAGALLGGALGFADGGVVPGGAPFTDRIPIMATPQERILNRGEAADLNILSKKVDDIAMQVQRPTSAVLQLNMGVEQIARVMVEIDRRGLRARSI